MNRPARRPIDQKNQVAACAEDVALAVARFRPFLRDRDVETLRSVLQGPDRQGLRPAPSGDVPWILSANDPGEQINELLFRGRIMPGSRSDRRNRVLPRW